MQILRYYIYLRKEEVEKKTFEKIFLIDLKYENKNFYLTLK